MNSTAYELALDDFRAASDKFRSVTKAYRAREIGDDEYLTVRAIFETAKAAMDEAERIEINA